MGKREIEPAYLTRSTLAGRLEISESTVDEMVRRGVLPKPIRLSSGCVRWRWESVDAALASMMPSAEHAAVDPYMAGIIRADEAEKERRRRGVA